MVLKLKEICLTFIAREFNIIKNFDYTLLNVSHKEIIIERLVNHSLINYQNKFNNTIVNQSSNKTYRNKLITSFFNGYLSCLKFNSCSQLDADFLELISNQKNVLKFKSLVINRCNNLTDTSIKNLISTYSSDIEEIYLTNLNIKLNQTLAESIRSIKLVNVNLSGCALVTDQDVWSLCKNNSSIKQLKLTHCQQLTNNGIRAALHMLNQLEVLDIEGINDGGCSFFIEFSNLIPTVDFKNLIKLNFSGSNELNSVLMKVLFKSCQNIKELGILFSSATSLTQNDAESSLKYLPQNLVSLSLYRPSIKNAQLLVDSLAKLKNLKSLSLYCVECLTDKFLVQILENNGKNLNELNLGGYMALPGQITDTSLNHISRNCKQLTSISFELLSATSSFESLLPYFENVIHAKKIEVLNFSACRSLNRNLLMSVCLNCTNLMKLELPGLHELVDDNLIEQLASTATNLKYLDIKGCMQITDISICSLSVKCSKLELLCMAGISSLTDKCIISIANNLQLTLRELYLSGCTKITQAALRYLTDCCVNYLYYEHKIPNMDPNQMMAKNLDTGFYERADLLYNNRLF